MKKIAIVTSLMGAYDSQLYSLPNMNSEKYDFICFSNQRRLKSSFWDIRLVAPIIPNDIAKSSYYYKWQAHKVLDHSKYSILVWIDSSVWQWNVKKFEEYLDKFIKSDSLLYIEKHPSRNTLKDELDMNVHLNKDDHSKMINQVDRYFKEGFDNVKDTIMVETGFSFRRFTDPRLIEMSDCIFEEMKPSSATKRDQLIFDYAVWKTKFRKYISLFTFEQKCEILMFRDHAHRPTHVEKVVLSGPFQGEFGWELFAFQGYVRHIAETEPMDKLVVGTETDHKFLYEDIADQFILSNSIGQKNKAQFNNRDPYFNIKSIENKDLKLIKPSNQLCYNLLSNLDKQSLQEFNFPEDYKNKYNLNFDEVNKALRTKSIPNYLRKQLNLPLKNKFKFVVVGGPAEKYIEKCLTSIKNQTVKDWECAIVLTPANDSTYTNAKKFLEDKRFSLIETDKSHFVIKNFVKALEILHPNDDDIICTVDADDWLANEQVLETIDRYYMMNPDLCVTYGSWKVYPEGLNIPSNCYEYQVNEFEKGIRRSTFKATHFRTFRYKLFKEIPESDFINTKTNKVYSAAGDVAIMCPIMELAGKSRSEFVPEPLYVYNRETDFNEDKSKSKDSIETVLDMCNKNPLPVCNVDKYRKISLHDRTFPHGNTMMNYNFKNFDSYIEWDRINLNREVIFFTDFTFQEVDKFNNKEKYCVLIEPPCIFPEIYQNIKQYNKKFNKVFTTNDELLSLGENYCIVPMGGCWVEPCYQQIYPKSKEISIIASAQNRTDGHKLRHEVIKNYGNQIDVFGKGYNPIDNKLIAMKDYKFQLVIENCSIPNYFSEKLIDALMVGCVPIYYGSKNLGKFGFNMRGILSFNDMTELDIIIRDIQDGEITYDMFKDVIEYNFKVAKEYEVTENFIWKNYFRKDLLISIP
jgi:hypothetical protein